ncbi:T9SS type A sorting domain-containing protein [Algoriphagus sp. H41]|uniref:T9SS type A sorting domain-containing protein n=1 Tax=Algoriphagus oliviformis TaxID=2811231 RepID=A0ABS3C8P2_9BACT|nr:T9SS type A sorting domain-containing protein [Algoriphagus oliviformis]MBN7813462.1 T9SS type A sorting domain-containing protein [Algoriphagus oliviformis]
MKSLFTVALASALSFGAFTANASEDLRELSAVNTNYKKVNITLKEGVGNAKISILTTDGKYLSSRKVNVRNENLLVPYDLENLPAGEYQVKIVTNDEAVTYTVETKNQPIPAADLPLMAYGKSLDEHTVRLAVIGLLEPGVDVKIYASKTGNLIHEEQIDQPEGFVKNFSFDGISADEVHMKVTDAKGRVKTLFF